MRGKRWIYWGSIAVGSILYGSLLHRFFYYYWDVGCFDQILLRSLWQKVYRLGRLTCDLYCLDTVINVFLLEQQSSKRSNLSSLYFLMYYEQGACAKKGVE